MKKETQVNYHLNPVAPVPPTNKNTRFSFSQLSRNFTLHLLRTDAKNRHKLQVARKQKINYNRLVSC